MFAEASPLPYQTPPFDRIRDADFAAQFASAMAEQRREVAAITAQPGVDFANTVAALERSGQMLTRVASAFFNLTSSNTNDVLQKTKAEIAPQLSAHHDGIYLDATLFARVEDLYARRDRLGLDAESLRLIERYRTQFVRAGAKLPEEQKSKLRAINERLAELAAQFQDRVLKEVNAKAIFVEHVTELDGLSESEITAAADLAQARGQPGKWAIALQNTTIQPVLAHLENRAVRERVFNASVARGQGGEYDTTHLVVEMVKLRAERAGLLGYETHAAYVVADETAATTDAVNTMQAKLVPAALTNARAELREIQALIDAETRTQGIKAFKAAAWDWAFYAERVRKARYAYDETEVRPYFEANRVMEKGVLYAATALFGLQFKERRDIPTYHADVRTFEVFDAKGAPFALLFMDYFARSNKQGGAWMSNFVDQSRLLGLRPVIINNLNVAKPPAGQPALMTFDEVITAFHEFGHALHGLLSDVTFPYFSGTNVPRDFVEFPSQWNEMWALYPDVIVHYATHWQSGQPIPQALLDKLLAARKFNQGFATTEYLAAAIIDQAWHQLTPEQAPAANEVVAFEAAVLKRAGFDLDAVHPRYHTPYFSHIFSVGYAAAYYAYIWSDVLARDGEHWFKSRGGLQRANGDHLRAQVLSKGGSVEASTQFEAFYGGPPDIGPLLEHRGLALVTATIAQ